MKRKFEAWVIQAVHDAIARVLATCPGQKLPTRSRGVANGLPLPLSGASRNLTTFRPAASVHEKQLKLHGRCPFSRAEGAADGR